MFEQGNLVKVEFSIPPAEGLLEFGGKISGFAKVLRTSDICTANEEEFSGNYSVALEFCRSPKLCT